MEIKKLLLAGLEHSTKTIIEIINIEKSCQGFYYWDCKVLTRYWKKKIDFILWK